MVSCIIIVGDTGTRVISGICEQIAHIECYVHVPLCWSLSPPINMPVLISNTSPPTILVTPAFIKAVCILLVMLPVSLFRNISSLEKVIHSTYYVRVLGIPLFVVLNPLIPSVLRYYGVPDSRATDHCPIQDHYFVLSSVSGSVPQPCKPSCHWFIIPLYCCYRWEPQTLLRLYCTEWVYCGTRGTLLSWQQTILVCEYLVHQLWSVLSNWSPSNWWAAADWPKMQFHCYFLTSMQPTSATTMSSWFITRWRIRQWRHLSSPPTSPCSLQWSSSLCWVRWGTLPFRVTLKVSKWPS